MSGQDKFDEMARECVDGWLKDAVVAVEIEDDTSLVLRIAALLRREVERARADEREQAGGLYAVEVRKYDKERYNGGEWRALCGPGRKTEFSCPSDLSAWPMWMVDDDPHGNDFALKRYETPEAAEAAGREAVLEGSIEDAPTQFRVVQLRPELSPPRPRLVKRWNPTATGIQGVCEASMRERKRLNDEAREERRKRDAERLRKLEEEAAAIRARGEQHGTGEGRGGRG